MILKCLRMTKILIRLLNIFLPYISYRFHPCFHINEVVLWLFRTTRLLRTHLQLESLFFLNDIKIFIIFFFFSKVTTRLAWNKNVNTIVVASSKLINQRAVFVPCVMTLPINLNQFVAMTSSPTQIRVKWKDIPVWINKTFELSRTGLVVSL